MEPMQLRDLQTARGTALAGGRLGFSMVGSRVTPAVNQVEGKTVVHTRAFATGLSLTPHPINPRAAARVLRVEKGMGESAEVPFRFVKSIGQLITGEEGVAAEEAMVGAEVDEEEVVADVYECHEARKSMGNPVDGIVGAVRAARTAMQVAETMRVVKGVRRATTRHLASGKTVPVRQTTTKVEKKPGEAGAKRTSSLEGPVPGPTNEEMGFKRATPAQVRDWGMEYGARAGRHLPDDARKPRLMELKQKIVDAGAIGTPGVNDLLDDIDSALTQIDHRARLKAQGKRVPRTPTAYGDYRTMIALNQRGTKIGKSAIFSAGSGTAPATFTGGESLRVDNMTKTKKRLKQVRRAVRRVEKIITTLAGAGRPEGGTK
jgi:hypothetical protein